MSSTASTHETEAQPDTDVELASRIEELADHDAVPEVVEEILSTLVERDERSRERIEELEDRNRQLRERVDQLEDDQEHTHDVAKSAVGTAQANEQRLDDVEDANEKTRDIAKCASAKAEQLDTALDDDGTDVDGVALPGDLERSTSPLDFFSNCRMRRVKEMFVEEKDWSNTYRTIAIAKRWDEFATRRNDGSAIAWTRDDIERALTAHLGRSPYRETISRVWDKLIELGRDDVRERTRQVGPSQDPYGIIEMDIETARGLQENRYLGLELLKETTVSATNGGVTPVVTGQPGKAV